jgi:hypothetical protein
MNDGHSGILRKPSSAQPELTGQHLLGANGPRHARSFVWGLLWLLTVEHVDLDASLVMAGVMAGVFGSG